MIKRLLLGAGAAALLSGAVQAAPTTIETITAWNGASGVSSWGTGGTRVYGQSFTAPAGVSVLNRFTFRIGDGSAPIPFEAYLYEWDGNSIIGSALGTSPTLAVGGGGTGNFLPALFAFNAAVTPGTQYIAFLSSIGKPGSTSTNWGYLGSDVYAGGGFWFFNTNTFADLSSTWESFVGGGVSDLAFCVDFDGAAECRGLTPGGGGNQVPEPATLALFGAGLVGLAAARRRKSA